MKTYIREREENCRPVLPFPMLCKNIALVLLAFQALSTLDHAITFLAAWRTSILSSACVRETAATMGSLCADQTARSTRTIARWK